MGLFLWTCFLVLLHTTLAMDVEQGTTLDKGRKTPGTLNTDDPFVYGTTSSKEMLDVTENNTGNTNVFSSESTTVIGGIGGIASNGLSNFTSEHDNSNRSETIRKDGGDHVPGETEKFNSSKYALDNRHNKTVTDAEVHFVITDLSAGVPFLFHYVLNPAVAIPGFVCNVFNIYVLRNQGFDESTTYFLLALSVADLLFLAVNIVSWSFSLLQMFMYPVYVKCMLAMRFNFLSRGLQIAFGRISNLFVLVLSMERFIAVRFPFIIKLSPFTRQPVLIVTSVSVVSFLIFIPAGFTEEYFFRVDPVTNTTTVVPARSDIYKNHFDIFRVYSAILVFGFRILPIFFVLVFNLGIVVTLKQYQNQATKMKVVDIKRQQKQLKITRMLITIAAIFVVCSTPVIVHTLLTMNNPAYFNKNVSLWVIVQSASPLLDNINSALNFFVYIVMSEKFRAIFYRTFVCARLRRQLG